MAGVTNDLQRYVDEIDLNNSPESDLVITSGEQISVGLLTMVMNKKHIKSHCMLGWQVPIITNNSYGKARILKVEKKIILKHLKNYDVIVSQSNNILIR